MITLEWKEEKDAQSWTTHSTATPLGKATVVPEECYDGIGMVYHLYLNGAYMGDKPSVDEAKTMLIEHLATKAREIAGEPNEIPLAVTRESLVREMTTLAQGQYDAGAQAALHVIEAAFREAAKAHPDTMVSFDDAVTFVLAIKAEVFRA